jgi:hypothetical protein
MSAIIHPALERLGAGQLVKIGDAKGLVLAVFDGLVWVTQDGDPRDAFVAKGGAFAFDRQGLAIIEALKESRIAVLARTVEHGEAHEPACA